MNWNLSIAYPWWFLGLCILIAALYAGLAYFRSKDVERFSDYPWVQNLLPVLRFILVFILCFLLLGPVIRYVGFDTKKPILALLVDNSSSLSESGTVSKESVTALTSFSEELEEKYDVEPILFSNLAEYASLENIDFTGTETNLSYALRYVQDQYVNRNLGGAVLFTDGIFNAGSDPGYVADNLNVPIYTMGAGDTSIYADIRVKNVSYNSLAYLGNEFPMQIEVDAKKLQGSQATIQVTHNGQPIFTKQLSIVDDFFFKEITLNSTAKRIGANKIDVSLTVFDNEQNKTNNTYTFYVEVIDGKKKVAIWAKSPHPDVGMLKSTISRNDKYVVTTSYTNYDLTDELDLVILHNWFQSAADLRLFEKLIGTGTSVLTVVGDRFNPTLFNQGIQDVKFTPNRGVNSVLPILNSGFEYFDIAEEQKVSFKKWPPLSAPFGSWTGYAPSDVLFYQQIGAVPTKEPLVLLTNMGKTRLGIITGTGIWQWRMSEYELNNNHENVEELVNKMVQYLAVREDRQLLSVNPSAKQYGSGDEVTLVGELYNQSLDAVTGQEINIDVKDPDEKVYKHTMTAIGKQYKLELSGLKEGAYQYTATSTLGGVKLSDQGGFIVLGAQKEQMNLSADFKLLKSLSFNTGGKFYPISELESLSEYLKETTVAQSIISEQTKLLDLIKLKWVFWLLVLLLSIEWLVRKWAGGY